MSIFKRGRKYWFHFWFNGEHIQRSTKQGNPRIARQIEAAHRVALAKGEVGLTIKPRIPTLEAFVPVVMDEIKTKRAEHPRTPEFYQDAFNRVLRFGPMAKARLDDIKSELLSRFASEQLREVAPATVNRCFSAIRRALYLAYERELINRVPKFEMLDGDRRREFVLTGEMRDNFISGLPDPSRTVAQFLVDTGLRITECCLLTWDRVFLETASPYISIDRGKTKKAKRSIPLTDEATNILKRQMLVSKSNFVFVRFGERVKKTLWYREPVSRHTISSQFSARRDELGLPWDAVLHSTRHTALTDFGAAGTDAFTIRELAGHASVKTSENYVHPVSENMNRAVVRLEAYRKLDAEHRKARQRRVSYPATISTTVEVADSSYSL